jgi:hypothetical protein
LTTSVFAVLLLLGLASPVDAATSTAASSAALSIAKYAVATASHDQPAQAVTAADVSNAVATTSVNMSGLALGFNIGELVGYSRVALFTDSSTYSHLCVDFPNSVGAVPTVTSCTPQVILLWQSVPGVLNASRDAVATAASHSRPVTGADVVKAAASIKWNLVSKPTFASGQGGRVKFTKKLQITAPKKSAVVTVSVCVSFPKTAYGIPVQVAC